MAKTHSLAEVAEAAKRYWGEGRNARRRERYRTDALYREKLKQKSITTHRKKAKHRVPRINYSANMERFGETRSVLINRVTIPDVRTFSIWELGRVIGKTEGAIRNWIKDAWIPVPVVPATTMSHPTDRRKIRAYHSFVYTEEEAEAIVEVLKEHYASRMNLTSRDTGVINAIALAVKRARIRQKIKVS